MSQALPIRRHWLEPGQLLVPHRHHVSLSIVLPIPPVPVHVCSILPLADLPDRVLPVHPGVSDAADPARFCQ